MRKKEFIILLLVVVSIGMGIGYSILSKQLKVEGTATIGTNFDLAISGIEKIEGNTFRTYYYGLDGLTQQPNVEATEISSPTFTSTVANFDVSLTKGATISYLISLKNTGDIDAVVDSVDVDSSGAQAIAVVEPISRDGAIVDGGDTLRYILTLSYDETKEINEGELQSNISVTFNFKQKTTEEHVSANPSTFLTFEENVVEEGKIVGVKLKTTEMYYCVHGMGASSEELLVSIDGSDYVSYGWFEGQYIFPEHVKISDEYDSYSQHTIKLKTNSSTEVTLITSY